MTVCFHVSCLFTKMCKYLNCFIWVKNSSSRVMTRIFVIQCRSWPDFGSHQVDSYACTYTLYFKTLF